VEFCPQGYAGSISLSRQYRSAGVCPDGGAPLLKPAVAFPGDKIEVSANGIRVNGQLLTNSAGRFRDHLLRPLEPWPYGTYKVEPGTVWVVSSFNSYSFDSRYYGPIPDSTIRHHLRPLWTFATEAPQQ
jgi:conjugative transfer signal peptidase TraF